MRELKFRYWYEPTKEMIDWFQFQIELTSEYFSDKYLIVVQYTGFTDKYENEIYEGDILIDREIDKKYIITSLYDMYKYFGKETQLKHIKIIGNIYENGDLLNG